MGPMKDQSSVFDEVKRVWAAAGVTIRRGVADADIRAFEKRFDVQLPDDVTRYLRTVDGMNDGEFDEHYIHFWPLSKWGPVTEELGEADPAVHAGLFVFADYSVWAHAYAIRLVKLGTNDVVIVSGGTPIRIAGSLSEFLVAYLREPESVFRKP